MELIEKVARALAQAKGIEICSDASYAMSSFREPALAAIRAMLGGVEPVADALRPFAECVEQVSAEESDEEWAKFRLLIGDYRRAAKALYSLDALKEAL